MEGCCQALMSYMRSLGTKIVAVFCVGCTGYGCILVNEVLMMGYFVCMFS